MQLFKREKQRVKLQKEFKKVEEFYFPERITVKYNKKAKNLNEMSKNVYYGYPSTTIKSESEEKFEKYCEKSNKIKWWYKNGESSNEFFSIIYLDKMNKAWTFYPDYIIQDTAGKVWIIETKGGEDEYGNSKNIDIKIENKYESLKAYAKKYKINWGFIRDINEEIFISYADEYKEEMKNKNWINVKEIL